MSKESPLAIGLELIESGRYAEAVLHLGRNQDSLWCLHHLGLAQSYMGDRDEAFKTFELIATKDWKQMYLENNPYFYLGALYFLESDYRMAVDSFLKGKGALSIEELLTDWRLFRWSGVAYQLLNETDNAIQNFCVSIISQQRQPVPVTLPMERLLVEACAKGFPVMLQDFEYQAFRLDLRAEVFESLRNSFALESN